MFVAGEGSIQEISHQEQIFRMGHPQAQGQTHPAGDKDLECTTAQ